MSRSAWAAVGEVTKELDPILTIRIRASDAVMLIDNSTIPLDRMEALKVMFVEAAKEEMAKLTNDWRSPDAEEEK